MKKEYIQPTLVVENVVIADSAVASYTLEQCVGMDCVTATFNGSSAGGYVYMKDGKPYYCAGFGEFGKEAGVC